MSHVGWEFTIWLAVISNRMLKNGGPVYTGDFSSLLQLFCGKMGVEPNWKFYRKLITRARKPVKSHKYNWDLTQV